MADESAILTDILELNNFIAKEQDYVVVIEKIMDAAMKASNADGCFFYTLNDDCYLSLDYTFNKKLNIKRLGSDNTIDFPTIYLPDAKNKNRKTFIESCALSAKPLNASNMLSYTDIDNSFLESFDEEHNYKTISVLTLPIISRRDVVIGIAQFINARDENGRLISFSNEKLRDIQSICSHASVILENRRLRESYTQLLESFIEVIARAIDAKSPYTGAHCQRVPIIARMLAASAVSEDSGPLKDFDMDTKDWYNMHIASWLHDCGKVTTPEYIVDKATKLETINNRIHEIRNRFEILRRDAHIEYLKKRLKNVGDKETLQAEFLSKIKSLEDSFNFVAGCNTGDKALTDEDIARLEKISQTQFTRYFSRLKGLSWAERDNIKDKELYDNPSLENLLQNRTDHIFNGYNNGELYNLKVHSGTINKEEREKINEHIVVTIDMLKALPFPKELENVVEYAGAHHERMDGKGYPNGLTGNQMSIPARIMAIADVFEALTASDRPYKEPKKLSEVLKIMQHMKNSGHIDPDLYYVFIKNKVYKDYAEHYISESQIDDIDPDKYL